MAEPRARPGSKNRRVSQFLLIVALVLFVNLPVAHLTWTDHRVATSGVDVTATVENSQDPGVAEDPDPWIYFRFSDEIDPGQELRSVLVDRSTYDAARAAGTIEVRVLESRPSAFSADGEVHSLGPWIVTGIADLFLVVVLLLFWRYGGRRGGRPLPRRIAAIGDVERCPPGGVFDQVEGTLYLARGEVVGIEDDEVVLDIGDHDVVVVLDGHANPVGYQQPAQVRGRLLD